MAWTNDIPDEWHELQEVNEERARLEAIPESVRTQAEKERINELARVYIGYMGGGG